ncbi:non-hydrolyzing UDP-N-acetylglucosamine 2-epimerase [Pseudomonas putida]
MVHTVLCIVGTRPEAIKMAPVIKALQADHSIRCRVLATAQHRHMLDQVLQFFDITPDLDLDIMRPNQSLGMLTARLLSELDTVLQAEKPDVVLAQGDTTTVLATALACFYLRIPFGHIEAGLRTADLGNPFPEEANRVIASKLARWHFAPTQGAVDNLLREGIRAADITLTGNTVIDALLITARQPLTLDVELAPDRRLILVTVHRRESFGQPFQAVCQALKALAEQNPDVQILYPVHPNPNVKDVAYRLLGHTPNIVLCDPLDYAPFIAAMKSAYLIISDSGGVQEEGPALGKPVLVLRDDTERPEAVNLGVARLVGTDRDTIIEQVQRLLDDPDAYESMARGVSPYGDGQAAPRIVDVLRQYLQP